MSRFDRGNRHQVTRDALAALITASAVHKIYRPVNQYLFCGRAAAARGRLRPDPSARLAGLLELGDLQTGRSAGYVGRMAQSLARTDPSATPQGAKQQVSPRRGRPGYDLESLLAVAVTVFNERGYDGTSMEDLSRRLGISKSSIYYHVDSKEDLLALALDRALDGLFRVAEDIESGNDPAIVRLERLVRGSVEVLAGRLPYVTLLLRARGNTDTERTALARRREFDQIVAELVAEAEQDGDIRPDVDPAITARLLFGLVNSLG